MAFSRQLVLRRQHRLLQLLSVAGAAAAAVAPPRLSQLVTLEAYDKAKRRAVSEKYSDSLPLADFLKCGGLLPTEQEEEPVQIIDVRAPCEFAKGHIPGAINLPLFSDDGRAEVGTLYKQAGHDAAVSRGLEIVDNSWQSMLDEAPDQLLERGEVLVYCKRGGMRSGSVAWLLSQAPGLRARTLQGGYAAFRHWVLEEVWEQHEAPLVVLGGRTGSGKTDVLHALRDGHSAQIIDLEGNANHRGSAFGALGLPPQPAQQCYENGLALEWAALDTDRPTFIEDEGAHVGSCGVPQGLWAHMRAPHTPVLRLEIPREARVARLVREYGPHGVDRLGKAVSALAKRLGTERTEELLDHLAAEPPRLAEVADALLTHYYDALYDGKAAKRAEVSDVVRDLVCDTGDASAIAPLILDAAEKLK